jgi:hypothetical protein
MPTSVLMHSAAEAMAELFARVWGEPVQIRIGKTIIAREPKT